MTVITNIGSTELAANSAYTLPFTAVTGRALIVEVSYGNAITGITGISDSGGNTWVEDYSDTSPNGRSRKLYRCQTVGTVPTTVTVTGTAGTLVYHVYEMTGLATSAALESAQPVAGVSGTSHSVAYTTVTDNACVILASIASAARGTVTPTNGFTNITTSRLTHLSMYNQDVSTSGSKTITYTTSNTVVPDNLVLVYKTFNTDPTVSTVTSSSTSEGAGSIVFTVTLTGATTRNTVYAYSWGGTATAVDYTQTLTTAMCARTGGASGDVTVAGSNITAETGVSAFTITVPTTPDALDEADETAILTVGGVSGTGTITDDDVQPTVTISDATEVAGTVTFVATLSAASGKTITFLASTADGTKTAGVDYTALTGSTVTFNPGETTKNIVVTAL